MKNIGHEIFKNDPFLPFYNLNNLTTVALTTDVDWAPDFATSVVLELVNEFNFPITVFATHESDLLKNAPDFVEVGLHPDYTRMDGSRDFAKKIRDLKAYYPKAVGLRCHRNFFGQNISDAAKACELAYDVSSFLWKTPFCQAHLDYNKLVKLSYVWEDGIHADTQQPWDVSAVGLDLPGLKILNVHPILIYLNCPDDAYRRKITSQYTDLTTAPYAELKKSIYSGYGFKNFYRDILTHLKNQGVKAYKINEMVQAAK